MRKEVLEDLHLDFRPFIHFRLSALGSRLSALGKNLSSSIASDKKINKEVTNAPPSKSTSFRHDRCFIVHENQTNDLAIRRFHNRIWVRGGREYRLGQPSFFPVHQESRRIESWLQWIQFKTRPGGSTIGTGKSSK